MRSIVQQEMFLRYAYSPSFEPGWAIGVQLFVATAIGADGYSVPEGFVYTKRLKNDAYVKAAQLDEVVSIKLTPAEMETDDIAEFSRLLAEVSLIPCVFPWASMDGALSSLVVSAGDSTLTAEWNTDHPSAWVGLEELHSLLMHFFTKYRREISRGEQASASDGDKPPI